MDLTLFGWMLAVAGVAMAFIGRRIFWLTVALAGFALGFVLTQYFVSGIDPVLSFAIGVLFGIVAGILTVRGLPLIAAAVGAILFGLAASAFASVFTDTRWVEWVLFAVGAALGWWLVSAGVGAAIIVLTALCGGVLLMRGLESALPDLARWVVVLSGFAVTVAGLLVQFGRGDAEATNEALGR